MGGKKGSAVVVLLTVGGESGMRKGILASVYMFLYNKNVFEGVAIVKNFILN